MITLARAVGGELRKLAHPLLPIVGVLFLVFVAAEARTTYHFARLQTPVAVEVQAQVKANAALACQGVSPTSQQCQLAQLNEQLNSSFGDNGEKLGRVTNALSTWPGMLTFVSHHLVTGSGWLLIGVLICLQTASEWRTGTATSTFNAVGSLRRFLFAKIVSLWFVLILLPLVVTSILFAMRMLYLGKVGVPDPPNQSGDITTWQLATLPADSRWSSLPQAAIALAIAAAVVLALVAAGTALASAVRKPLVVLVAWVGCLAVAVAVGQHGNAFTRTFTRPIGDLLKLSSTPYGVRDTDLWQVANKPDNLNVLPAPTHLELAGVLVWAVLAVLVVVVAGTLASRRRVLG
jgi:hypothetical protein